MTKDIDLTINTIDSSHVSGDVALKWQPIVISFSPFSLVNSVYGIPKPNGLPICRVL
jgi:hypothetical protein